MIRKIGASVLAVSLFLALGCGGSRIDKYLHGGKPLVRVGKEKIHEGYFKLMERVNPSIKPQIDAPMGKKKFLDDFVEKELLYQESVKRGLHKSALVKERLALWERVIVAQALLDQEVDIQAEEYYKKNKESEFERVKVAHIFFSSMPKLPAKPAGAKGPAPTLSDEERQKLAVEAAQQAEIKVQEAYNKLVGGESWESVLTTSEDKSTASRGGDMGYVVRKDPRVARMDYQGIVDQAFSLAKGAYSTPIKAKDGWHIIQILEEKQLRSYSDVELEIKGKLREKVKGSLLANLRKDKVQYLDPSMADTPPRAAPSAPESRPTALPSSETKASGQ